MYPQKQRVPGTLQLISTLMLIAVFGLGGVFDLQAGPCAAPRLLIGKGGGVRAGSRRCTPRRRPSNSSGCAAETRTCSGQPT